MIDLKPITKISILVLFMCLNVAFSQNKSKFKVVLDAGHGGKDYGNIHHGFVEKKIALAVTLKVGELLKHDTDFDLIFSRSTDVFVELKDRANNANKADADLFVSIHCNAAKNFSAFGTETFVMGLSRSAMNLEVAKNENSVILLEDDYKEKYNGFDPSKPESLLGIKILQEEFLNQSIELAAAVQDNFTNTLQRKNRSVKQAPLWVLDASYMPGVLIEIGFLSNKEEGAYLNTEQGQDEISKAIADAILGYKKNYFKSVVKSTTTTTTVVTTKVTKEEVIVVEPKKEIAEIKDIASKKGIVFKVQIAASSKKMTPTPANFKGLLSITREDVGKIYKYYYSNEPTYNEAQLRLIEAKQAGYPSSFIVAYKEGVKIDITDALK